MHHSTCKMAVPVNQYREKDRLFVELHFILDYATDLLFFRLVTRVSVLFFKGALFAPALLVVIPISSGVVESAERGKRKRKGKKNEEIG